MIDIGFLTVGFSKDSDNFLLDGFFGLDTGRLVFLDIGFYINQLLVQTYNATKGGAMAVLLVFTTMVNTFKSVNHLIEWREITKQRMGVLRILCFSQGQVIKETIVNVKPTMQQGRRFAVKFSLRGTEIECGIFYSIWFIKFLPLFKIADCTCLKQESFLSG